MNLLMYVICIPSGLYLGLVLVLAAIGILLTVMIILTYHKHGSPDPCAWYMKLMCVLARVICWYNTESFPTNDWKIRCAKHTITHINNNLNNNTSNDNNNMTPEVVQVGDREIYIVDGPRDLHKHSDRRKLNEQFDDVTNEVTWKHVALVLDRFCFYVFSVTTVLMNVSSLAVLSCGNN